MKCPSCKNKGFEPTPDVNRPLKILVKYSYDTVNQRQVICLQCGCSFITNETFERLVEVKKNLQQEMFENGSK